MFDNEMLVAEYAAKQPRGNDLWDQIIDKLMHEIDVYLQFTDLMREA